jgi:hypothetical protein
VTICLYNQCSHVRLTASDPVRDRRRSAVVWLASLSLLLLLLRQYRWCRRLSD